MLQVALMLIKQHGDVNYPVLMPDPIKAITAKMKDACLRNKDLVGRWNNQRYDMLLLNEKSNFF